MTTMNLPGTLSRYGTLLWRTLVYARQVRGTVRAPASYLIAAHDEKALPPPPRSDLFRLTAPVGATTLQDLVGAFATSPLFRLELTILKLTAAVPPSLQYTLERSHLEKVARNQSDTMGFWKDHRAQGDPAKAVVPSSGSSEADAPTRIMRCEPAPGAPFCDTWWSVEASREVPGTVDWVFGTALLPPDSDAWILRALDPFHRLYSRLLLASARANYEVLRAPRPEPKAE